MKTRINIRSNCDPLNKPPIHRNKIRGLLLGVAALFGAGVTAQATNILANPGFETTPIFGQWTAQTTEGWSMNVSGAGGGAAGGLFRTGANALWMQGLYLNGNPGIYYNMGAVQTFACSAGSTYSADAWFSQFTAGPAGIGGSVGASTLFTSDASGVEDGWVEVQFLDSNNNILADYKSAILSPITATQPGSVGVQTINVNNLPTTTSVIPNQGGGTTLYTYLTWLDCPVIYQYDVSTIGGNIDPATESVTNVISGGVLTAPAGAAYVKYFVGIAQAQYEAGASYWDDCTLNQLSGPSPSLINTLAPNGLTFFYTNTSLTFTVNSASTGGAPLPTNPTSGVKVVVNGVDLSANLQFGGTSTNLTVTLPNLASNSLYQAIITVVNSAGLTTTVNDNFDTLQPSIVVPFETYDYNSGQFIQNPVPSTTLNDPSSYFGRLGVLGVDLNSALNSGPSLLPNYPNRDGLEAWEIVPDAQLPLYLAVEATNSGVYNVDHNYYNGGNWFNYTRNPWPSGNQEVWLRCSSGNTTGKQDLNILTSGYGTTTQTTNRLGEFDIPNVNLYNGPQGTDWEKFYWVPLTDEFGNIIPVSVPSGQQTLQLLSDPVVAGMNVYVMAFVPFPSSGLPPTIGNINPPNGAIEQPAAAGFSFAAGPGSGTINNSGIALSLNGVNVTSHLGFSGSNPINATYSGLLSNTVYTAVISATNSAGAVTTRIVSFDTYSEPGNFYVKMEDFDGNSGNYDTTGNGLVPNAYIGDAFGAAVTNVDYSHDGASGTFPYRGPTGLAQEPTSDAPLPGYTAGSDWDVGNFNAGDWANYTRNYPAGKYYVYARLAGFSGNVTLSQVTAGLGTTTQTLKTLGTCYTSVAKPGWQTWNWCPLLSGSVPAVVTFTGVETLRATSGGGVNANYIMLVPVKPISISAAQAAGSAVALSFATTLGSSYSVWQQPVLNVNGAWTLVQTVAGDGTVKTVNIPASGSQGFIKVTSP
jgi:hypothetical protein